MICAIASHYVASSTSPYAAAVLADSPIGYWRLGDRSTGLTAADSSGNGSHLTYQSAVTSATGLVTWDATDAAATFNADTQWAESTTTNAAIYGLTGLVFSIEVWVKWTSFPAGDHHLVNMRNGTASDRLFLMRRTSDAKLYVGWRDSGANYRQHAFSYAFATGTGYHIVATFDGTNGRLYVNGSLVETVAQDTAGGGVQAAASNSRFVIGRSSSLGAGTYAAADIDEVALYNTALSAGRISTHATGV